MKDILTIIFSLFFFFSINSQLFPQDNDDGVIEGKVFDLYKNESIEGAVVKIPELNSSTITDVNGHFIFIGLVMDSYQVVVSESDYETYYLLICLSDSNKHSYEEVFLKKHEYKTDTIKVKDFFLEKDIKTNVSFNYYDFSEIQRDPGAGEDIIKFFQNTSGVYIGNDRNNDLLVRGGSPIENLILIDGIEIKNPNHYASPGTTNGALSYINLKLVEGADFYAGAFPSIYGDKLSSVLNIHFREGNRERHIQDLNLSMTGFGGVFEGPINKNSSYIFSVRRSYLELIESQLNMDITPNYWDFNLKMNYDLNDKEKLSLISFLAIDNAVSNERAEEWEYKDINLLLYSSGLTYEKNMNSSALKFDLSFSLQDYNVNHDSHPDFKLDMNDKELYGKVEYDKKLTKNFYLNSVLGLKYLIYDDNIFSDQSITPSSFLIPSLENKYSVNSFKIFSGVNVTQKYFDEKLILNTGIRFDYFDYMEYSASFSPRAGATIILSPVTSINAGYGIFYQTPEILWLASHPSNKSLKSMRADHYVVGMKHFFNHELFFDVEIYHKEYRYYPVSVYDPYYIFINSGTSIYPNFLDEAVSVGDGFFEGMEISLQKRSVGPGFYGRINVGLTRSKFRALVGDYYPSEFDYGRQLNVIAGYDFQNGWQISSRFRYSDGRPFTPYDVFQSYILGRGYYDMSLYNADRLPEYVRLDVRIGKKIIFKEAVFDVYLEVHNILNRDNVYSYYWDYNEDRIEAELHWSILPILGISAVF